ncbi:MAG: asparagine synthase (glutamine-hydrolyzing) [Pirellula sp.]|nr:asparagine synthase (glutamine-hydrolyzing) [Pirellula sp.]
MLTRRRHRSYDVIGQANSHGAGKRKRSATLISVLRSKPNVCGIAGFIGIRQEVAERAAPQMLEALAHRGPDGNGIQSIPTDNSHPVVLVHSRLAILDTSSAGRQPMSEGSASDGSLNWLTFNGEIYNFRELRSELATLGLHARSNTDTEVLLLAYRAWGEKAVEKLCGMFAFCLVDMQKRRIWLVRDRLGIKPLYVARPSTGGLLFASEVRALLAAGSELVPRRLSRSAVESFLAQGVVYGKDSHIEGISSLSPGESLVVDWEGNTVAARKYWITDFRPNDTPPKRVDAVAELGAIARDAVRQHLISDVPIGVFLSGGIDSAAIATLATESGTERIRTISVGFDQPEFDETSIAAEVAQELGTDHYSVRVTAAEMLGSFERVLAAIDQPTVDGFNTFTVSQAARAAGVKVALSGLGGDECFGGYASFRDVPRAVRFAPVLKVLRPIASALRRCGIQAGSRGLLKFAEAAVRTHTPLQLYLLRRELFLPSERRSLQALPHSSDPCNGIAANSLNELQSMITGLDPQNTVSALELGGYMRNMLLRDADVFSMAHGLEIRVPFLDHRLVDQVTRLPGAWKQFCRPPKPLLTEAVGRRLPALVRNLSKRGFTFPWSQWFRKDLATIAADRLNDRGTWNSIGFHPSTPATLWQRFLQGDPSVGGLQILGLIVLADVVARQRLVT